MIKNILKVAFRYLAKHKGYTLINIIGLAVGIAACILIMLFVRSEWSFNKMHSQGDRIGGSGSGYHINNCDSNRCFTGIENCNYQSC